MKKYLKLFFIAAGIAPLLAACSKADSDTPDYQAYMTVRVDGNFYYFVGDDGKTYYPGDVSRIVRYDTEEKDGKRVYIRYSLLPEPREGYDYNIALYFLYDILSKTVEVAETEEQVEEAGDGKLFVESIWISGGWLDIMFSVMTTSGVKHKLTLLDNLTVEAPKSMPEGYRYLEFRQLPDSQYESYLGKGLVSFDLGEYDPAVSGTKGLYIRVNDLYGAVRHLTVKYEAPNIASTGKTVLLSSPGVSAM